MIRIVVWWRALTVLLAQSVVFLWIFKKAYSLALIWALVSGEAFIGFLVRDGIPVFAAITIAVCCSTYEIFTWFLLFGRLKKIYPSSAKPDYGAGTSLLSKIRRIGGLVYYSTIPHPGRPLSPNELRTMRIDHRYYQPLFIYGFLPGCMWSGVGYTTAFNLSGLRSFLFLTGGNLVKMVLFGLLGVAISPWAIILLIAMILFFHKKIEIYLRSLLIDQEAPLPEEA